ncbi:MAG: hypothetical protein ACFFD2_21745, partial [Promethearchaeota archaeon]
MTSKNENLSLFDKLEKIFLQNGSIVAHFLVPILVTLFFIEAFRTLVPGIYAALFHVVFADPGWVGSLMTILTLLFVLVPLFTNKLSKLLGQKKLYLISIAIIAIIRILIACNLSSLIETILAGIIIAFYGIFASLFLKRVVQDDRAIDLKAKISIFSIVFIASFLIDMVLRTIGFSTDISLITIHLDPTMY